MAEAAVAVLDQILNRVNAIPEADLGKFKVGVMEVSKAVWVANPGPQKKAAESMADEFPALSRNLSRILSSLKMLELNISDILDL